MSERFDALVIGGGLAGLAAVSLLAKAGLRALLIERSALAFDDTGEAALNALDPLLVKELKLGRRGLKFAARDLALAALRGGAPPLVLSRDRHATANSLAVLSPADAAAYAAWRRDLLALARALRRSWWDGRPGDETLATLKPAQRAVLERLGVASALAWLADTFESDALRAALAFDAAACGAPPSEPGSALALLWNAAQEMSGRQGAFALPRGGLGGVLRALSEAAQKSGAEIRTAATVSRLLLAGGAVAGVELASGETIAAPLVLSTLSRRRTLGELLPPAEIGLGAARALAAPVPDFGTATLLFTLGRPLDPPLPARTLIAERTEIYEAALCAVRLGQAASEPALELVAPPPEAPPRGRPAPATPATLVVRAWPVAASYARDDLVRTVTAMIDRHLSGFGANVASCDVVEPQIALPATVERLLGPATARIETPVAGLLLCGPGAEPANALSGRAARQAARLAVALHRKGRAS